MELLQTYNNGQWILQKSDAVRKEEDPNEPDDGHHLPVAHIYNRRTGDHVMSQHANSMMNLRSWLLTQGYSDKGGDKWYNHMHDHYVNLDTVNSKDRNAMVAGTFKAPPAKAYPSNEKLPEQYHSPIDKPHLVKSDENTEIFTTDSNGQWSLEKSNYGPKGAGLYDKTSNIKRKETRTSEVMPDIGPNTGVRDYTTSGSSVQAAHEAAQAKEQKAKAKSSVKIYTDEEKRALEEKMKT